MQGTHQDCQDQLAHSDDLCIEDEYRYNGQQCHGYRDSKPHHYGNEYQDQPKHGYIQQGREQQADHEFGTRERKEHQLGDIKPFIDGKFEQGQEHPQEVDTC